MQTLTHDQLRSEIAKHSWFHSIDLGSGIVTPGRFDAQTPPNWTLYGVMRFIEKMKLNNSRCLDIGTFDGLTSFILKKESATYVKAVDIFDLQTFRIVRDALALDVDYMPGTAIEDLAVKLDGKEQFDLAVMAGVLYHLYDPLMGLVACRKLLKSGGFFLLETEVTTGDAPALYLNTATDDYPEPFTYWRPTVPCVKEMLKLCCFQLIGTIKTWHRHTFLAKAVKPSDLTSVSSLALKAVHSQLRPVVSHYLDFRKLESSLTPDSAVNLSSPIPDSIELDPLGFKTRFDLQPQFTK